MSAQASRVDVLLVGCVKTRRSEPAPAKELFTSDYFSKMRTYAEATGLPWCIVTAEHGVVDPDQRLEPYSLCLADMAADARREWGVGVGAQLEELLGPLRDAVVEIHAGSTYVRAIEPALQQLGAEVRDPLRGLSFGRRLAWYRRRGVAAAG